MKSTTLLGYASKSVFRQKSRNAFIIVTISILSIFSLFMAFLFEGKNHQLEETIIKTHTGTQQVLDENYFTKSNPYDASRLDAHLRTVLGKNFLYSPELLMETTILHPSGADALTLIGIDPLLHEQLFPLGLLDLKDDEVAIGTQFSKKLNLKPQEMLVITYQNSDKAILNESLNIKKIYHQFGEGFQETYAFVTRKRLIQLMGLTDAEAFHRIVLMPKNEKPTPAPLQLQQEGLLIKSWRDLNPELSVLMKFHNGITNVLLIFMLIIAGISIITPISIMWDERSDEIRMLQTIGARYSTLRAICAYESMFIALASFSLTLIVSTIILSISMQRGIDFAALGSATAVRSGIVISSIVRPVINWWYALIIVLFNFFIVFGCNLWSVRTVSRKMIDAH